MALCKCIINGCNSPCNQICQMTSIQSDEKERVHYIYHSDSHYCIIISHNTSVPMIGHFELAIGTLMSHSSWAWLIKIGHWSQLFQIGHWSQVFHRCIWSDLDLIVNKFKQIGFIQLIGLLIMNAAIVIIINIFIIVIIKLLLSSLSDCEAAWNPVSWDQCKVQHQRWKGLPGLDSSHSK